MDFVSTFGVDIVAGRNFLSTDTASFSQPTTNPKILVNEEVVQALGYKTNEAAINQPVTFSYKNGQNRGEIIGVVKNYHQRSLKEVYDPFLYVQPSGNKFPYFSIRVATTDL